MMHGVDAAGIFDSKLGTTNISYPTTFKDLTRERRELAARLEVKRPPSTLAVEKKLNDNVTLNMKGQTIEEAVTFLQNYTGLTVVLDPKALQEEGLSKESKVDLVGTMKLKTALKFMLRPLGLTFKVEDDVLLITSPQATRDMTYVKTYSVADLVIGPDRNPAAALKEAAAMMKG